MGVLGREGGMLTPLRALCNRRDNRGEHFQTWVIIRLLRVAYLPPARP